MELVGLLLSAMAAADHVDDGLLHIAALNGHLQVVQLLLVNGYDPSARFGPSGYTSLHAMAYSELWDFDYSTKYFPLSAAEALIESGTDINAITARGQCALELAMQQENIALAAMLLDNGADPLMWGLETGRHGTVVARRKRLSVWAEKDGHTPDGIGMLMMLVESADSARLWFHFRELAGWAGMEGVSFVRLDDS